MNKILIIIKREYLTRIRKKTFIVMSILGPMLFSTLFLFPAWFVAIEEEDIKHIAVFDESWLFRNAIPQTSKFKFTFVDPQVQGGNPRNFINEFKENLSKTHYFGFVYIPEYIAYVSSGVEFYSYKQPPANLVMHIANAIEKEIEAGKLRAHQIEDIEHILHMVKTRIGIRTYKLSSDGDFKESNNALNSSVAIIASTLIYLFIFLFASNILRGVIEEKNNRIVEVIVSSVKPFELMMGKVVGVALVGLTQFFAWAILTLMLVIPLKRFFFSAITEDVLLQQQTSRIHTLGSTGAETIQLSETTEKALETLNLLQSINFGVLICCFLFFFIGGFLLYGSLYAAIGSAVDTEADSQQFLLPVTAPLIIALMVMMTISAAQTPDSTIAFWFSMIPFTSPIVMMTRIAFGVPYAQVALSMSLLVIAFVTAIWLSAKIYRTGILTYGKKMNYSELWKWLKY